MKYRTKSLAGVVCLLSLLAAVAASQELGCRELPNFHKISDGLYRGAQPLDGGMKKLAELGVKSVVNLRGEDDLSRAEQKEAEAAGLRYFNVSMPGLSGPSDEQIARVIAIIDDSQNQPVFIHCKRGSDRTGTIAAIYRIRHDGWTADRAIAEAKARGMSWAEFGMRGYISDYYKKHVRDRERSAVAATP